MIATLKPPKNKHELAKAIMSLSVLTFIFVNGRTSNHTPLHAAPAADEGL